MCPYKPFSLYSSTYIYFFQYSLQIFNLLQPLNHLYYTQSNFKYQPIEQKKASYSDAFFHNILSKTHYSLYKNFLFCSIGANSVFQQVPFACSDINARMYSMLFLCQNVHNVLLSSVVLPSGQ